MRQWFNLHPGRQEAIILKHLPIERQVSYDLLQPGILVLELLEPLHLGRQQTGIVRSQAGGTRRIAERT